MNRFSVPSNTPYQYFDEDELNQEKQNKRLGLNTFSRYIMS